MTDFISVPHVAHCALTLKVVVGGKPARHETFSTYAELEVFINSLVLHRDFDRAQQEASRYSLSEESGDDPLICANYGGAIGDCRSVVRGMVEKAKGLVS